MQASYQPGSPSFSVPPALTEGDHSTDLVFIVEGQRLHFSKILLTLSSPVFQALLTPDYVQQHSEGIPLEKNYDAVAFFFMQLHPVFSPVTPITDGMLLKTLALAQQYKVEHLSAKCEQYIGSQLQLHDYNAVLTHNTILMYLLACEQHHFANYGDKLVKLAANCTTEELLNNTFFKTLPETASKEVFLTRSQNLEKKTKELESSLSDLKSTVRACSYAIKNGTRSAQDIVHTKPGRANEYLDNVITRAEILISDSTD